MITKPTLLLDVEKCKKNIREMFDKAKRSKTDFRPHFKTHQSLEIGRWFKNLGVNKITVSSFEMARYFSEEWNDITVAFPVNLREIETINKLAQTINLNILVESEESVKFLNKNLKKQIGFFIKIDVGYQRTGIPPRETDKINEIIETSRSNNLLNFKGFLTHAGQTYDCRSKEEILQIHQQTIDQFSTLKHQFREKFPDIIFSIGDTPGCSVAEDLSMFDEIRPGNFVFYDLSQNQIGSCRIDQIAVALACPIVAIHPQRNELVIYGGGVHLSKERMEDEQHKTIYGLVAEKNGTKWGEPITDTFVKGLSQEHGIISVPENDLNKYEIGDYLLVLPVHSCMTANLMKSYQTTDSKIISRL